MTPDDPSTRQRGVVTRWNDARGFGFIEPIGGGSRLFVHVSAFPNGRRPVAGCEVSYVVRRDQRNRPGAEDVHYRGRLPAVMSGSMGVTAAAAVAAAFGVAVAGLVALSHLPVAVAVAYVLLSATAFGLYLADKSAARQGRRRIAESTLHAIDLLGGWPGALLAQQVIRHKTIKQPFRSIFWLTVIANCVALGWWTIYR